MRDIKVEYNPEHNCRLCIDSFPNDYDCDVCLNATKEKVTLLEVGVGIHADKAIIKLSDGTLKTVSINTIKIPK